jgi:TRAP-type C4-dicarboxylate transport system permease small subunit
MTVPTAAAPTPPPGPSAAWRLARAVARLQTRIAMAAAAVIILTTTADVILRYGFAHPIHGAYDMVECMLVLFVFHGIAGVFFDRANITIDLVDHVVGLRARLRLVRIADRVSIALLGLVGWAMISPALQAYDYGDRKLELGVPLWVVWLFALSGMAGTIVCALGCALGGSRPSTADAEMPH